jgi:hypothetical protein
MNAWPHGLDLPHSYQSRRERQGLHRIAAIRCRQRPIVSCDLEAVGLLGLLSLLTGSLEFPVTLSKDRWVTPGKLVSRRDIANGAVNPDVVK